MIMKPTPGITDYGVNVWHGTGYEEQKKHQPMFKLKGYVEVHAPQVVNQATGESVTLYMKCLSKTTAVISIGTLKAGGIPVAKMQWVARTIRTSDNKHGYQVTIAPGVDAALIMAMCIRFDLIRYRETSG